MMLQRGFFLLVSTILWVGIVAAQVDCEIYNTALELSGEVCISLGENEACYGNNMVDADLRGEGEFDSVGDIEDLPNFQSLRLSRLDDENNTWGITRLRLLVPDANTQRLFPTDIVMFGEVEAENEVTRRVTLIGTISANSPVNVRLGPSANDDVAGVVAILQPGEEVEVVGRLAFNDWLRVFVDDGGEFPRVGWIQAALVDLDGAITDLEIDERDAPYNAAMQVLSFNSVGDDDGCGSVDGMLIQTPQGLARLTVSINEVVVDIFAGTTGASTVVTAPQGGDMTVSLLSGAADVSANGETVTVPAGAQTTIPLGSDNTPMFAPNDPEPYTADSFAVVSTSPDVTVAQPADPQLIVTLNNPPTPEPVANGNDNDGNQVFAASAQGGGGSNDDDDGGNRSTDNDNGGANDNGGGPKRARHGFGARERQGEDGRNDRLDKSRPSVPRRFRRTPRRCRTHAPTAQPTGR